MKHFYTSLLSNLFLLSSLSCLTFTPTSAPLLYGSGDSFSSATNEYSATTSEETENTDENSLSFPTNPPIYILAKSMSYNPIFTKNYFSHLDDHLLENTADNCGYVAMGMLLGFYDSYVSDDFLPEQYDYPATISSLNDEQDNWSSPGFVDTGIIAEIDTESYKGDILGYRTYDMETYLGNIALGNSLLKDLYQIAIDQGRLSSSSASAAINAEDIKPILTSYLKIDPVTALRDKYVYEKIYNLHPKNPMTNYTDSLAEIRDEIINNINKGIPVICGGTVRESQSGHVVVAYDYNPKEDIIYGNLGYKNSGLTHVNLDTFFSKIDSLYSITYRNLPRHSDSNNYYLSSENQFVCSCELASHECGLDLGTDFNCYCRCPLTHGSHAFTSVSVFDTTYHKRACSCGRYWTEKHTYGFDHRCTGCQLTFFPGGGSTI